MKAKYATQIRIGIQLARDTEHGDFRIVALSMDGEELSLKAFMRERIKMIRRLRKEEESCN